LEEGIIYEANVLMVINRNVKTINTPCPIYKRGYLLVENMYSMVRAGTGRMLASLVGGSLLRKIKDSRITANSQSKYMEYSRLLVLYNTEVDDNISQNHLKFQKIS
jgi:hypothetical protein